MKISYFLFIFLFIIGIAISNNRYVWGDEICTAGEMHYSYLDIVKGKIPEGCNSPIYYVAQKLYLNMLSYSPFYPKSFIIKPSAKILLRIPSIIFMSLAITLVFSHFAETSMPAALTSLVLFMPLHPTWNYMTEARPYSLIVLLTVIQILIFLRSKSWKLMAGCNLALALTSIITVPPVLASYLAIKRLPLLVIGMPLVVAFYYHLTAPHLQFYLFQPVANGFPVTDRYFIYLLPLFVMAVTIGATKVACKISKSGFKLSKLL